MNHNVKVFLPVKIYWFVSEQKYINKTMILTLIVSFSFDTVNFERQVCITLYMNDNFFKICSSLRINGESSTNHMFACINPLFTQLQSSIRMIFDELLKACFLKE